MAYKIITNNNLMLLLVRLLSLTLPVPHLANQDFSAIRYEMRSACMPGTFRCLSAGKDTCVKTKRKCNIFQDCDDSSDEKECLESLFYCDMEDFSDCGIHLESEEMADSFKLTKAVDVGIFGNYGPSIDQTRKSGEGHYLYFYKNANDTYRAAILEIPIFLSVSTGIRGCLGFFISMSSTSSLMVLTTDELGERVAAVYRVVNQSEWTKVEIPLRYDVNLITISAGATDKTLNEQGYVAIDDLYIHRGECKQKAIPTLTCHDTAALYPDIFRCKDGSGCIDESFVCNLQVNCADGSDEENCLNYSCPASNRKIEKKYVCNSYPDCLLGEDEIGCVCKEDYFTCQTGGCVKKASRCDGFSDCLDGSDEIGCPCKSYFCNITNRCLMFKCQCPDPVVQTTCPCQGFRCKNKQCVSKERVCDEYEDCDDGSDEYNCQKCKKGQVKCVKGGQCIQREWLCDGYPDCPEGADEENCGCDPKSQFECAYKHICIPIDRRCDGNLDCRDGSDEAECVSLDVRGIVQGLKFKRHFPFCSHGWKSTWSDKICALMNKGAAIGKPFFKKAPYSTLYLVAKRGSVFKINNFVLSKDCPTKDVVHLFCSPTECGLPTAESLIQSPYIIGGHISKPGQWPYIASVLRHSGYVCTGALIHQSWVLTAAHCFTFSSSVQDKRDSYFMPWIYKVRLGTNVILGNDTHLQEIGVKGIHSHYLFNTNNFTLYPDIALVELSEPVVMDNHVRPACLPESILKSRQCYVLGWGIANLEEFSGGTNYLRQAKMQLDLTPDCILPPGQTSLFPGQMCLGYPTESLKPCHGDSGGPLMCRSPVGRWSVAGVISSGPDSYGTCASKSSMGTIFTDVEYFLDWIMLTMSSTR